MLDDTPVVPGDTRIAYSDGGQARQILNDCEDDLRDWRPEADVYEAEPAAEAPGTTKAPALEPETEEVKDEEVEARAAA